MQFIEKVKDVLSNLSYEIGKSNPDPKIILIGDFHYDIKVGETIADILAALLEEKDIICPEGLSYGKKLNWAEAVLKGYPWFWRLYHKREELFQTRLFFGKPKVEIQGSDIPKDEYHKTTEEGYRLIDEIRRTKDPKLLLKWGIWQDQNATERLPVIGKNLNKIRQNAKSRVYQILGLGDVECEVIRYLFEEEYKIPYITIVPSKELRKELNIE